MLPHHERAAQKAVEFFSTDENTLAVLVGGSIAKGLETPESDVDLFVIVPDELFEYRKSVHANHFMRPDFADYPGGYVEGKFVSPGFLRLIAEKGSEPTRAAYVGVITLYSKMPQAELDALIEAARAYPDHESKDKLTRFYGQYVLSGWLATEALRRKDSYLLAASVADMVLYGSRMILAHNRILYPHRKFLLTRLREAPDKPENIMELTEALLAEPSLANISSYFRAVKEFQPWIENPNAWGLPLIDDMEMTWLNNRPYVGDI